MAPSVKRRFVRWLTDNPYEKHVEHSDVLFVHIPKNAGGSMKAMLYDASLWGAIRSGHIPVIAYEAYARDRLRRTVIVCCVRNPWDRLFAAYTFLQNGGLHESDRQWAAAHLNKYATFGAFVHDLKKPAVARCVLNQPHFSPQHVWLRDSHGTLRASIVLRMECLKGEVKRLGKALGTKLTMRYHRRRSDHPPYTTVYSNKMVDIVQQLYAADISLFDYTFPDTQT